eukprot:1158181-Pelagomonas_calceolata.AAC.3
MRRCGGRSQHGSGRQTAVPAGAHAGIASRAGPAAKAAGPAHGAVPACSLAGRAAVLMPVHVRAHDLVPLVAHQRLEITTQNVTSVKRKGPCNMCKPSGASWAPRDVRLASPENTQISLTYSSTFALLLDLAQQLPYVSVILLLFNALSAACALLLVPTQIIVSDLPKHMRAALEEDFVDMAMGFVLVFAVQVVFDLPKRMRAALEEDVMDTAVGFYAEALPLLKKFGHRGALRQVASQSDLVAKEIAQVVDGQPIRPSLWPERLLHRLWMASQPDLVCGQRDCCTGLWMASQSDLVCGQRDCCTGVGGWGLKVVDGQPSRPGLWPERLLHRWGGGFGGCGRLGRLHMCGRRRREEMGAGGGGTCVGDRTGVVEEVTCAEAAYVGAQRRYRALCAAAAQARRARPHTARQCASTLVPWKRGCNFVCKGHFCLVMALNMQQMPWPLLLLCGVCLWTFLPYYDVISAWYLAGHAQQVSRTLRDGSAVAADAMATAAAVYLAGRAQRVSRILRDGSAVADAMATAAVVWGLPADSPAVRSAAAVAQSTQGQLESPEGWGFGERSAPPSLRAFITALDEKFINAVQSGRKSLGLPLQAPCILAVKSKNFLEVSLALPCAADCESAAGLWQGLGLALGASTYGNSNFWLPVFIFVVAS